MAMRPRPKGLPVGAHGDAPRCSSTKVLCWQRRPSTITVTREDSPREQQMTTTRGPQACPTLKVVSARGEALFALDRPDLSLGRAPDSDIRVDAEVVSGVQARLVREGPTYRFIQLGETNPTLLRGVPVAECVLNSGGRLEIAPG